MAKFIDTTDAFGVMDVELPTSSDPMLGLWNMTATAIDILDSHVAVQKSFTIDEYVLPKFEVEITIPESGEGSYLTRSQNEISGVVSGTYTYGKPVKGSLTLNLYEVIHLRLRQSNWLQLSNSFMGSTDTKL